MIPQGVHHFGKRIAWSLLYFLNYAYFDILRILKFWESVSNIACKIFFMNKQGPLGFAAQGTSRKWIFKNFKLRQNMVNFQILAIFFESK